MTVGAGLKVSALDGWKLSVDYADLQECVERILDWSYWAKI